MKQNKSVCVIGLGYIGLPTAALLASNGYDVLGVDLNESVVNTINKGEIHIVEPDLDAYVRSAVTSGKLKARLKPTPADIFIICVPTPFHKTNGTPEPNIDFVLSAAESISEFIAEGNMVILESTSPVGTTELVQKVLQKKTPEISKICVAYCPERVLPGKIMIELVENDRVVGGVTPESTKMVSQFYRTFVRGEVLETDARTAEMCKLTENSFRDINIAFANELSIICHKQGINVWNLINLANRHPRVNILQPGTGVGGHCIAVDPWFIVAKNPEDSGLIRMAREVNNHKTKWVTEQILARSSAMSRTLGRRIRVVLWGIAFKPDIDDLRESPAIQIAEALVEEGLDINVVEPNIKEHSRFVLTSIERSFTDFDLICVLVRHRQFGESGVRTLLSTVQFMDFCGLGA